MKSGEVFVGFGGGWQGFGKEVFLFLGCEMMVIRFVLIVRGSIGGGGWFEDPCQELILFIV